jgi:hypothetical protein
MGLIMTGRGMKLKAVGRGFGRRLVQSVFTERSSGK